MMSHESSTSNEERRASVRLQPVVGDTVGALVLEAELGSGIRGRSFIARDHSGVSRRVKLLHWSPVEVAATGFPSVLPAARAIGHQRLCVPELVEVGQHTALTEPYTESHSITGSALTLHPGQLAAALLQLVDVLTALHSAGVAHGALHNGNVRVNTSSAAPELTVVDIGMDRVHGESWRPGTSSSADDAWRALAPEQRLGLRGDPRSDLYALGWLLLDLLAAERLSGPFARPPAEPRLDDPWRGRGLESLLVGLLESDPTVRADDAGGWHDRLRVVFSEVAGCCLHGISDPIECWVDRVLEDPFDARASDELEGLAVREQEASRAVEGLVRAAELAERRASPERLPSLGSRRISELLAAAGRLQLSVGKGAEAALPLFIQAARAFPQGAQEAGLVDRIGRLAGELGQPEQLVEVLLAIAETMTSSGERAVLFARVGELCEVALCDPDQALVAYLEALCLAPDCLEHQLAVRRLSAERESAPQEVASRCLQAINETSGNERQHLLRFLASYTDGKVNLDPIGAACLSELLHADRSHRGTLDQLIRVLRRLAQTDSGRWMDLGAALLHLAQVEPEAEPAAAAYTDAAMIAEEHLANLPAALDLLEQALGRDGAYGPAIEAQARIAERLGDHERLVRALDRKMLGTTGHARAELLVRIAELRVKGRGERERSLELLSEALSIAPSFPAALLLQERLLHAADRHRELAQNLEVQALNAAVPQERLRLWERIAHLHDVHLLDPAGATRAWQRVVELSPNDSGAIEELRDHLRGQGQWEDAVAAIGRLIDLATEARIKAGLHLERAEILEVRMGDPDAALADCLAAVRLRSDDQDAREAVVRIATARGRTQDAVAALDQWLDVEPDPAIRASLHVRAAALFEASGDTDSALARCQRAFDLEPMHVAAEELAERCLGRRSDSRWLLLSLERRLERVGRPDSRTRDAFVELSVRIALLALEQVGDRERARRAAESVLPFDPRHPGARLVLGELALAEGRHHEARSHLDEGSARAGALGDERLLRYLEARLGVLVETSAPLSEVTRAVEALLARTSAEPGLLLRVCDLCVRARAPTFARDLAERVLAQDGRELSSAEQATAHLCVALGAQATGEGDLARAQLEESLRIQPSAQARE